MINLADKVLAPYTEAAKKYYLLEAMREGRSDVKKRKLDSLFVFEQYDMFNSGRAMWEIAAHFGIEQRNIGLNIRNARMKVRSYKLLYEQGLV